MDQMCAKCGFKVEPQDEIVVYGMRKHRDCFGSMIDRLNTALVRAEAAERRVAELEALLTDVRSFLLQLSLEAWRENTEELEQKLKALGIEPIPPPAA